MNTSFVKCILSIFFLVSSSIVLAQQKEITQDLVPYKKGKLWGLVHHDKQEYYPPVLDSIIVERGWDGSFRLFQRNKTGEAAVDVIYKGERMWLTKEKNLLPNKEKDPNAVLDGEVVAPIEMINQEGIKDESYSVASGEPVVVQTLYIGQDKAEIKKAGDTNFFFLNGKEIPQFKCAYYYTYTGKKGYTMFLLGDGKGKMALADIVTQKLVIPFEYNNLSRWGNSYFLHANKDELNGLIDDDGKIVLPVKYPVLQRTHVDANNAEIMIASDGKVYSFIKAANTGVNISKVTYQKLLHASVRGIHHYYIATKAGKMGIVKEDDTIVLPLEYTSVQQDDYGDFFILMKGKKFGFADPWNNFFVSNVIYDKMEMPLKTSFVLKDKRYYVIPVKKNGQTFYVDNFGTEFITP